MLTFPKQYFDEEIRDGFKVDTTMKTVWAAELEVLSEVAKVCQKHQIQWYMAYGSLLGAVRHEGFIPWDDDMDIWMMREDYMRFLTAAQEELPDGYLLKSPFLEEGYPEFHSCVLNSDSISIEPEHLQRFHGCPFVVGIDIFPMDVLPDTPDPLQYKLFQAVRQCALMVKEGRNDEEVELLLQLIEKQCNVTIDRAYLQHPNSEQDQQELVSGLWGLANEIAMWHEGEESREICMYLDYLKYKKKYQRGWFEDIQWCPYEGFEVPVPVDYDDILRVIYGDYTVKIRNSAAHDYPFYKKQLEELRKRVQGGQEC